MRGRRGVPAPCWSPEENRVLGRCVRGVLAGRFASASDAARACVKRLEQLRGRGPDPPARSISVVYERIQTATRQRRRGGLYTPWSAEEEAVFERHVRALVAGRFEDAKTAARACHREIKRLWRRQPASRRAAIPRTERAILSRMYARAASTSWQGRQMHWSEGEQAILKQYVDALVQGRYSGAWEAARACREELEREFGRRISSGRALHRSVEAVYDRLHRLANKHGWTRAETRLLPQEHRILERHARRLLGMSGPRLTEVARQCFAELARLHDRLRTSDPDAFARVTPRKMPSVLADLLRRALKLGRPVAGDWQDDEMRIVIRHARALVARRHKDADAATLACRRDLAALRRNWRTKDPQRYHGTRPRPYEGVYRQVRRQAHALGQRWPQTRWTPKELVLLKRAVDWYERHHGIHRLRPSATAVEGLQLELEQIGSHRTLTGCNVRFWTEWQRRHGLG